ncbi:hypothetical protein N0V90_010001 [Kalmusia sp. IMI 367209]|nr:hypothetical protein N0V90_010001 [Kalmusia sp. IMI 367209]
MSEPKVNPPPTEEIELHPILSPAPEPTAENGPDVFTIMGSVIAASAKTSSALIGGRALSGIGAVGLTVGGLIILTSFATPQVQNVLVAVASAVINLLGTGLFALCLISLLLALQYGVDRPWDDPLIVALLIVSAAALPVFLFQQTKRTRQGLFPRRIIRIRNVWAACGLLSFLFATLGAIFYYLPLFFQAVQGLSARDSGFRTIAYVVSSAVGVGIAVAAMTKLPYLNPLLIAGSSIFWISTGLFTTFDVDSSTAYIVGIQVLAGVGFGLCVLCQTVCPRLVLNKQDIQLCHSVTLMLQVLASSFSIQIANIALSNLLSKNIKNLQLPPEVQRAALGGLEHIRQNIPADTASKILTALSDAFRKAFNIGIATAAVAWAFSLCVEWRLLEGKDKKIEPQSDAASTSQCGPARVRVLQVLD